MLFKKNLRNALNNLLRAPGYFITIVLTLGITLGALSSIFNLNYLLSFEPLPYPDQSRLVISNWRHTDDGKLKFANAQNYPGLREMANSAELFEQHTFIKYGEEILQNDPSKSKLKAAYTGPEFMQLLAAEYALGRGFQDTERKDSHNPVAVISYDFWQDFYAGSQDVLGQTLEIQGTKFSVIGVTSPQFVEPQLMSVDNKTQVWMPWDFNPVSEKDDTDWGLFFIDIFMVAKLQADQSPKQAELVLSNAINTKFRAENAGVAYFESRKIDVTLEKFETVILGDTRSQTLLMLAGMIILLLIAAVNVTNLVLARAANNHRKFSIQAALGANKRHIFSAILAEIGLVMTAAAVFSVVITLIANNLLVSFAQNHIPRVAELHLNVATVVFSFAVAWLLAFAFATITTQQIKYRALAGAIQTSGKGSGLQISRSLRTTLMASQVALSALLVTCNAYVLSKALDNIQRPLGFESEQVAYVSMELGGVDLQTREQWMSLVQDLKDKIATHPSVAEVSIGSNAPMARTKNMEWTIAVTTEQGGGDRISPGVALIDEQYVPLIGLPMHQGRNFTAEDVANRQKVAIINRTMAEQIDPSGNVLDRPVYLPRQKDPYIIVGIVEDMQVPAQENSPRFYIPSISAASFMVKYKPNNRVSILEYNQLAEQVHSQVYLYDAYDMTSIHDQKLALDRIFAWISASLGVLSILLAAIGLYGMFSYSVTLRKFELGVRMAIGAAPNRIISLLLKDAMTPLLSGIVIALLGLVGIYYYLSNHSTYFVELDIVSVLLSLLVIVGTSVLSAIYASSPLIRNRVIYSLRGSD
ncbi:MULTISPECIES: ABC transporter permease [unclassified Pseudoalteromonas]|uniref:ABC transporter permease n=1 Tax=unclassified Pseudoalteromonas TaxID=194690 RepID=UPI002097AF7B|nr:ABC transporter permease [Pseudoalteromonas sp. XMcav2-N]MCO7186789.1 ABC transporter permease [Pseudoalteromonas sp. XMcav2-N]